MRDLGGLAEWVALHRSSSVGVASKGVHDSAIGPIDPFGPTEARGILTMNVEGLMRDISRRIWIKLIDERGASMVEYALLIALIAIAALVGVALFGASLRASFADSTAKMP